MIVEQRYAAPVVAVSELLVYADYATGQLISFKIEAIEAVEARRANTDDPVWPGEHAYLYSRGRQYHIRASRATVLADIAAAVSAPATGIVLIQDQKAIGTEGGTATSGAWRTRDLQTEVYDADELATISSNQITLAAGFYHVWASALGLRCGHHQIRLRDMAGGGTTLLTGQNCRSLDTDSTATPATLMGPISLAIPTVLELQHRVSTTQATFGFGSNLGSGFDINVYSSILFRRA